MKTSRRTSAILLSLGLSATSAVQASPPYKNLPRAGFQSSLSQPAGGYSSSSQLPTSFGVHLTEGQDRRVGGPVERYDPGEPTLKMQRVRWEQKKMPLLIWLSPGVQLPECPFEQLQTIRVDQVNDMLRDQTNPILSLKQAKGWTPEVNDQVAAGIEQWREFENEKLFTFAFTDDPRNANIVVFFVDAFRDSTSPGGVMVGGNTSAQVYPYAQAQQVKIAQKPVVIELSTMVNNTDSKMMGAAAHEFGHALGIKAHSPYREDIMYADRIVDHLSPADKATIRYLYHQPPQWVL
ncbi:MAG TPA: matrixin family metalloprotease [Oculatellaceae cyanobacterium]